MNKTARKYIFLCLALLLPVLFLGILRAVTLSDGETSLDAYYHIRIAEQGPDTFLAKEFPAVQMSVWSDSFADKEMLFHVLLWPLAALEKAVAGDLAPPFNFEYLFFACLMAGAYIFAARSMGVRSRLVLAGVLLVFALTAPQLQRMEMLRPHLLSIALLFTAFGLLAREPLKFRCWTMLLLGFFFAWSYSSPHFAVIPAVFCAVFQFRKDKFLAVMPIFCAAAGILLGLLIHPQFPNTFTIWKVQGIDAVASAFSPDANMNFVPGELCPPAHRDFALAAPLYILCLLNMILFVRIWEYRGFRAVPAAAGGAMLTGLFFTAAFFWAQRAMEYAAPFSVLAFLALADTALREKLPFAPFRHGRTAAWILLGSSVLIALFSAWQFYRAYHGLDLRPRTKLAQYLKENCRPGEAVANMKWTDFPRLYYAAPQLKWQWGLDPAFSMAKEPRKTQMMIQLIPADRFTAETGLHRAVVLYPDASRANYMLRCGWILECDIPGGTGGVSAGFRTKFVQF